MAWQHIAPEVTVKRKGMLAAKVKKMGNAPTVKMERVALIGKGR
jgi:hypothetical protein